MIAYRWNSDGDFRLSLDAPVLQIMYGLRQLSQRARLDGVSSLLEVHDRGPGNSRLARETIIRKLVGNFIASRGGSGLPHGARESALDQIRTFSGHGHDRVP